MTKFIAVSNRRGGVGKTTTTMMLGYGLSVLGFQRVLVIDLDAQASTSITMMGHERWSLARRNHQTLGDVLVEIYGQDKIDIRPSIARQVGDVHIMPGRRRPDLDLLPCTFELDNREREILLMGAQAGPTVAEVFAGLQQRVAQILRSLDGHYDVVLMDCPPGLSNVAWGALNAADFVLVPYIPDATAQDNIGWFHKELMQRDPGKQVRVLANRVRANSPFQAGIMDTIHERFPSLGVSMPHRSAIAGALDFRSNSEALRSKFGDGAMTVDGLFNAVLRWFEQTASRPARDFGAGGTAQEAADKLADTTGVDETLDDAMEDTLEDGGFADKSLTVSLEELDPDTGLMPDHDEAWRDER